MRLPVLLVCAAALLSAGAGPGRWEHPAPGEAPGGVPRDISLTSSGALLLAPASEEILPGPAGFASPPLLLAAETDVEGNTFFGGGLDAKVLRVDGKGAVTTFFESTGVSVRALSSDVSGYLLVATMPNGRVYRVDPDGGTEVLFEPEERYLWAMATDAFDRTYLATGERGVIYSIAGPGEASVFFDSDEPHITSLATDPGGRLLAGSAGRGLLYRIDSEGTAEVLLSSGLSEISSIAVASDGTVYASAIRDPVPSRPRRRSVGRDELTIVVTTPEDDEEMLEEAAEKRRRVVVDLGEIFPSDQAAQDERPASKVYRISPGRTPSLIWSSRTEWVYSVAIDARGYILVGTGPFGRVYRIEPDGSSTLVRQYPATQVTSLVPGHKSEMWVLASNPGRVYRLDAAPSESGTYLSPVHDAGNISAWGSLSWDADIPKGTRISFATRSGNTTVADSTWSAWSESLADEAGTAVPSPPARFVQWRATLSRLKTETSPLLREASLTYLPENLPPEVHQLQVGDAAPEAEPGDSPAREQKSAAKNGSGKVLPGRQIWISWRSSDPDGDPLRHVVSIRGIDETTWKVLAEDLPEQRLALDTTDYAEGSYVARVAANDRAVNGAARGLSASMRSSTFVIDNSGPVIDAEEPDMGEESVTIAFSARDALGTIAAAEWASRPDGAWSVVLPRDGISDTASESFELILPLEGLTRQMHLRVTDRAGNRSTHEIALPRWQ